MTTITVKNIPTDIYEKLKQSAKLNHRSINSEIIASIERAVRSQALDPGLLLADARRLRERTAPYPITDDELTQAKSKGRP
jgi:plasmid stability protein